MLSIDIKNVSCVATFFFQVSCRRGVPFMFLCISSSKMKIRFKVITSKYQQRLNSIRRYALVGRLVCDNLSVININEIPSELSRENLISSHVKTTCYLHT